MTTKPTIRKLATSQFLAKQSSKSLQLDCQNLHRQFVQLGRERNKITYKLLALLPKIQKEKVYEREGYANIYDYAARLSGLSPGVVSKAIAVQKKIEDKPHLQKAIESQGINKVAIVVGVATRENERELAEKVENMSKPALQEYSKEIRGKVIDKWQVEMDEKMMFMFLKLKKKFGENLSNKEALRRMLVEMDGGIVEGSKKRENNKGNGSKRSRENYTKSLSKAKRAVKIPGGFAGTTKKNNLEKDRYSVKNFKLAEFATMKKPSRYIPVAKKREVLQSTNGQCAHQGCCRPAEVIHHKERFAATGSHERLEGLCKAHHEFAHNGISEKMQEEDYRYREHRKQAFGGEALVRTTSPQSCWKCS